jgi:tetratricopeptide (TPR) repeat protein
MMSAQRNRNNTANASRGSSGSAARQLDDAGISRERFNPIAYLGPIALLVCVFTAYIPAIRGDFIWDDDSYVTKNQTLHSAEGLRRIWFEVGATPQYYPLVFTTFWTEYHLWGLSPVGYHLVNILLHGLSAILVWKLLLQLEIPGAGLAAFIFALHPVHVESVAWITERKNVLSGFFYLAAMSAFLRFSPMNDADKPQPKWYVASLLLFVAALLSKTVTASLPAALLLIYWFKLGRLRVREIVAVLPMLVLGLLAGSLTAYVEKHFVGTKYLTFDYSAMDRILIAGHVIWFYAAKLVIPAPLIFIYPRWQINAASLVHYLFPLCAIASLCVVFFMRKKWGRGPLVAALFFGGTLFPALGFINVFPMRYSFVADHFQYLASLGLIVLIAACITRSLPAPIGKPLVIILPLILAVLTFRQCFVYADLETLWRDTLVKNPSATMARNNLGAIFRKRGKLDEAEKCYRECLADPLCLDRADILFNMATLANDRGDIPHTIDYCKQAIAERPSFPKALTNLGGILHNQGHVQEAIPYLERAVQSNPGYLLARNNFGNALLSVGRTSEAIEQLEAAIRLEPEFAEAHYNLGNAYASQNRNNEATAQYETAIKLKPQYVEARINLAGLLQKAGKFDEAVIQLQTALSIEPNHPLAHYNLGNALARLGRRDEAIAQYEIARRLRPDLQPPMGFDRP